MNQSTEEPTPASVVEQGQQVLHDGRERVNAALDHSKEYLRANPAPVIAGALALGFIIGLLVPREQAETRAVHNKIDELKDLLGSLGTKVSSSAGDGYSEVSSVLCDVLNKAKKRLHLS